MRGYINFAPEALKEIAELRQEIVRLQMNKPDYDCVADENGNAIGCKRWVRNKYGEILYR
jgi:hypothetical protein